jgi:hypothetical protein
MRKSLDAIFDGEVIRTEEPLDLEPNTRVRLTIEEQPKVGTSAKSFLRTARSLNLDGPPDWSERIGQHLQPQR